MRELEREFTDLNRHKKGQLSVHQKMISTRRDRCGALRLISQIPSNKKEKPQRHLKKGLDSSCDPEQANK